MKVSKMYFREKYWFFKDKTTELCRQTASLILIT